MLQPPTTLCNFKQLDMIIPQPATILEEQSSTLLELSPFSNAFECLRNHIPHTFHDICVIGRLAVEIGVNIDSLPFVILLDQHGDLCSYLFIHHITEFLDVGSMERVFFIAYLLPDARLFGLVLFKSCRLSP
jgi:hypothetical protein